MFGEDAQLRRIRSAVIIAGNQHVRPGGEAVADKTQLAVLVNRAEAQMHIGDDQLAVRAFHRRRQHATAGNARRQRLVQHFAQRGFAEDEIAVQREFAKAAVGLRQRIGQVAEVAQLLNVVEKTVAQAAKINFLQADEVKLADVGGDAGERLAFGGAGQDLPVPLPGITKIAACVDGGLNVVAQNAHGGAGWWNRRQL